MRLDEELVKERFKKYAERDLEPALTNLEYDVSYYPLKVKPETSALVVSFSGEYGWGSGGIYDALFMIAVTEVALQGSPFGSLLILDLRKLKYEWGNTILDIFNKGVPLLVVVSDLNREGFTSLMGTMLNTRPSEWLFESFDLAVQELERRLKAQYYRLHYNFGKKITYEYAIKDNKVVAFWSYVNGFLELDFSSPASLKNQLLVIGRHKLRRVWTRLKRVFSFKRD